mgnify:CR=1 FL=1
MGRGDIRSRKGKIFAGSFGNRRKRGRNRRKTATARR